MHFVLTLPFSFFRFASSTASILKSLQKSVESHPQKAVEGVDMNTSVEAHSVCCNCQRYHTGEVGSKLLITEIISKYQDSLKVPFGVEDLPDCYQIKDVYPNLCECSYEFCERRLHYFDDASSPGHVYAALKHVPCQSSFYSFVFNACRMFSLGEYLRPEDAHLLKPSIGYLQRTLQLKGTQKIIVSTL